MTVLLRLLVMPAVPSLVVAAARNALPAFRRWPASRPLSRYQIGTLDVRFGPRDLG